MDAKHPLVMWPADAISDADAIHTFGLGEEMRVQDCSIAALSPSFSSSTSTPSSSSSEPPLLRIAALCTHRTIHIWDYTTRSKLNIINMGDQDMTSLNWDRDGREMLVNISKIGEVWLIDDEGRPKMKFPGQRQEGYVIRSCFGGAREGVVVSGGEGEFAREVVCGSIVQIVLLYLGTRRLMLSSYRLQNQHLAPLHRPTPRAPRRPRRRLRQRCRLEYGTTLHVRIGGRRL